MRAREHEHEKYSTKVYDMKDLGRRNVTGCIHQYIIYSIYNGIYIDNMTSHLLPGYYSIKLDFVWFQINRKTVLKIQI